MRHLSYEQRAFRGLITATVLNAIHLLNDNFLLVRDPRFFLAVMTGLFGVVIGMGLILQDMLRTPRRFELFAPTPLLPVHLADAQENMTRSGAPAA